MNKIKNVKKSADASLAKVRSKKWSKPLGKTLNVTGKIVTAIGTQVPGKVITHKLCGEPFLRNRIGDLGWFWASWQY